MSPFIRLVKIIGRFASSEKVAALFKESKLNSVTKIERKVWQSDRAKISDNSLRLQNREVRHRLYCRHRRMFFPQGGASGIHERG